MPIQVINPYDQSTVCELEFHREAEVNARLTAAADALGRWREVSLDERIAIVTRGMNYFRNHADVIARDITRQMGKPLAQAQREVETMIVRAERSTVDAREALRADVLPEADGLVRRIEHEPLGVVLDIAAWNYPLLIAVNVVVPALLAGNVVLIKHSAKTPLCGQAFEREFTEAGVANLVTNLLLTHEQTARLIADERVDHVSFTGSVPGGRSIYKTVAAKRLIDVGLELGGKDPAYVAQDADIDFAAPNVVDGACYNAGQSCCAIERVYVHRSKYEAFLERARVELEAYTPGNPMDDETTMGPLASRSALDELQAQVEDAVHRGARLLLGGGRMGGVKGNFFEPTLLADVPHDAAVMREESFGPIVPVTAVDDDEQAIERMNDTRFGLTASVWTADTARAERFARALHAGTIYQNRCDYLDPALPWSGYGDSGKGSTLSRYGFYHLTRRKSIHFRRL